MFKETVASSSHHESCPYYLNTEWSNRIGIDTRMFNTVLSRVVDGTFSISFGARGVSISPSLSLRHIFRPNSPAFLLLSSVGRGGIGERPFERSPEDLRAEFRRLFHSREASPFDVDQEGRTLLNVSKQSV